MLKNLRCPVRAVWVFRKTRWVAFFTTDLALSVEQVIEAALFQYANHDRDRMRELILSSAGTDISVRLGDETLVLKFTEKHLDDLKTVLTEDVDAGGDQGFSP